MKTAILTDSNSGIFPSEGERLGISVLPMPVLLDGVSYFEGTDLSVEAFIQRLRDGANASTSQPVPQSVLARWDELLSSGYDEVLYIPMSAGLSSAYEVALGMARDFDDRIYVTDSRRVSVTLRDAVLDAARLARQGCPAARIRTLVESTAASSVVYLGVDTLKYFQKNGRCSSLAAMVSDALNLKYLLRCGEERFDVYAKSRGIQHCQRQLLEAARQAADGLRQDGPIHVGVASSFENPMNAEKWFARAREAFPGDSVHYEPLPFSVVCHTGLNAFGIGLSRKL